MRLLFIIFAIILINCEASKEVFAAIKEDLPYYECPVCEELAKNLARDGKIIRDSLSEKLSEVV
jgi:hypothetical protein